MGRVTVLYFAGVKDLAGTAKDEFELPVQTLYQLLEALCVRRPVLAPLIAAMKRGESSTVLAIDQVFERALTDTPLRDNAEVAFIAPISGG